MWNINSKKTTLFFFPFCLRNIAGNLSTLFLLPVTGPHQSCVSSWKGVKFQKSDTKQGCWWCCCYLANTHTHTHTFPSSNLSCFEPQRFICYHQGWWEPLVFLARLQLLWGEWRASLMAVLYLHIKQFAPAFIIILVPDWKGKLLKDDLFKPHRNTLDSWMEGSSNLI